MNPEHKKVFAPPSADDFVRLRKAVAWGDTNAELASKSLNNSLFSVSIYEGKTIIGFGRVVGDGYMYFYIQDVIVDPSYQGKGVGSVLMDEIESFLKRTVKPGSTVGLFAVKGKEKFYSKYGYLERTGDPMGKGMCKFPS